MTFCAGYLLTIVTGVARKCLLCSLYRLCRFAVVVSFCVRLKRSLLSIAAGPSASTPAGWTKDEQTTSIHLKMARER